MEPSSVTPTRDQGLSPQFRDFITAFMRAFNTARLYASGHELFKKDIRTLYDAFMKTVEEGDFLFIGCAREAVFLDGVFHEAKDSQMGNFLKFFHALGVSHLLLDRRMTVDELNELVGLLAGAKPGQGDDVLAALPRGNVRHAQIGLLDYSIFISVQAMVSRIALELKDEVLWRNLILQPAAAATLHVTPDKVKQLTRLTEDLEEVKKLLLLLDQQMKENQEGITLAQRGAVLGNFIQNVGRALDGVDPARRQTFTLHVNSIVSGLEPGLKTQILGSVPLDASGSGESGVLHDIFQAIPDNQTMSLLLDALKEAGPNSQCFSNLLRRALVKYKEPGMMLSLIRHEMQIRQEKSPGRLSEWQHLEQILMREQEIKTLNDQYHKDIEALAASIQIQWPLVEEEEKRRLLETISPESLNRQKSRLAIEVLRSLRGGHAKAIVPGLVEALGGTLRRLVVEKDFEHAGVLMRDLYLVLSGSSLEEQVRKSMGNIFSTEEITELLKSHLSRCRTYESRETATVDALCRLYPEKAGSALLNIFLDLKDEGGPKSRCVIGSLCGMGAPLGKLLTRRMQGAPEEQLLKMLDLAVLSTEKSLGLSAEALLDHHSHEIRLKAIAALGSLRFERSVPRLKEILLQKAWLKTKKTKEIQKAAAQALSVIGSEEARGALQEGGRDGSSDIQVLCRKLMGSSD